MTANDDAHANGNGEKGEMFRATECRPMSSDWCRQQGFASNRLYRRHTEDGRKIGYLVIARARDGDFALNKPALDYLSTADVAQGFVVLVEHDLKPVNQLPVAEMAERLNGVRPWQGRHGDYWWLRETFRLPSQDDGDDVF